MTPATERRARYRLKFKMPVECGRSPIEKAPFCQSSAVRIRVPLLRKWTGESQIGKAVDEGGD